MTAQPQTAAPSQTVPRTPAGALLRYLGFLATWLRKNLKEALTVAVIGFVIGWVMNFALMAFFYDGFRIDKTMAATGQGNVRNGMLIWSLFSSVAFGLIAYRRAVGKERFRSDLANFPGAIVGVFRKDGDAIWTHILWGAAVSLLATFLIARWAGLGVAAVLAAAAFSPLGLILAAMITQLWRAVMRSLTPQKTRRAIGAAGLFVGLFTSSLVLLAGFFITNEREKLILGGFCLVAAVVVGQGRKPGSPTAALLLLAPVLWLLFPELGLADDGGFKEAGGDFSAWARGGGLGEIVGYSNYGGVATAVGGLAGWMVGAVNGASPPPEGGWEAGLDGEPDLDPGGAPAGEGLPGAVAAGPDGDAEAAGPVAEDASSAADGAAETETPPDEAAVSPADPEALAAAAAAAAPAAPVLAADGLPDRELTDDEIMALSEEDYRKWRDRAPAGDPDSPAEIARRARAGDPEAIARLAELEAEGDPSLLDQAGSALFGPLYDAIGGSETIVELVKTDWVDETLDTAAALRDAAGRRIGEIADTTVETVSGAVDLVGMDADEVAGMFGAIGDSIADSAVGRVIGETVDGAIELASMDADEFTALAGNVRDDAVEAVADRMVEAQTLIENMTVEEAIGHLSRAREATGEALSEADRAIRRKAHEIMSSNPDAMRAALADGTIAVVEELVVEVATGGAGAMRHADDVVDLTRAVDNATDAARAADNATDAVRAADRGADAARAGPPDAPPVRDVPDAPDAPGATARPETPDAPTGPDAPASPDTPRADTADPAAPADAGLERRGPGPTDGGRPAPDARARAREADGPAAEAGSPGAADAEPPVAGTPGRRTGPGDTVELDPADGPGGVRPPGERPRGPGDTMELDPADGPGGVRPPGERPRGPGDTVELDPADGPGGVRPPDTPRQPAAASPEGAPPVRSEEPWTEADTVRTPRRSVEAPGGTDPGRPPRPATASPDAPDAPPRAAGPDADTVAAPPRPARPPDSGDGDLIFEMEDGKRVNMTTNRPEPPRPGSPADLTARGDPPGTPPRSADPGGDTLPDASPPPRTPDAPDGDLIFEMEDGKRVNMTTNRPEPPRPGSPADPAVGADTEILPGPRRADPGADTVADPPRSSRPSEPGDGDVIFEMEDGKRVNMTTNRPEPPRPGSPADPAVRADTEILPAGPSAAPADPPGASPPGRVPQPGDRAPRPLAEREAMANEPYDGPRGMSGKPPQWPDGTRRPPDNSDAAPGDLPRSPTPREGYRTDMDDPPYAEDPNIDARGRPIPEEVAEGTTAAPLPPGHRHNPLDKAYVDVTAPEREAMSIGRGAPAGRDDAIRAAHERYEAGVRQARENLDNPAFRERMNPESLRELEAAVDPANARSLEDFRRSAGMDPTPPPRSAPRPPDTPPMRDGPSAPPDDTPTLTPNRPGPEFTEGDTVLNPGRGPRPDDTPTRGPSRPDAAAEADTFREPGPSNPPPDESPTATFNPAEADTRMDPGRVSRTAPTERIPPTAAELADEIPTRRLSPEEAASGTDARAPTTRLPADEAGGVSRTAPTERIPPTAAELADEVPTRRLTPEEAASGTDARAPTTRLPADEAGGVSRTAPTERIPPTAAELADEVPTRRLDPPDMPADRTGPGGTERLDSSDLPDGRRAAPVDRAPAGPGEEVRPGIRRAPDGTHQVRMPRSEAERILGDAAGESASADPAEAARLANARFQEGMERARRDRDVPPASPDAPPDVAAADERPTRASRRTSRAQPPPSQTPDSPGDATPPRADPDSPPEAAAEEPRPKPRRPRVEPFARTPLPDVPEADFRRYEDVIGQAREDGLKAGGDWPSGGCEEAKLSLLKRVEGQPGWEGRAARVGPPGKAFDHEFAVSPEGHIVDPVARQFVDRGIWTDARLRKAGLLEAVNRGIFTPEQWARFTYARPQPNI